MKIRKALLPLLAIGLTAAACSNDSKEVIPIPTGFHCADKTTDVILHEQADARSGLNYAVYEDGSILQLQDADTQKNGAVLIMLSNLIGGDLPILHIKGNGTGVFTLQYPELVTKQDTAVFSPNTSAQVTSGLSPQDPSYQEFYYKVYEEDEKDVDRPVIYTTGSPATGDYRLIFMTLDWNGGGDRAVGISAVQTCNSSYIPTKP